MGNSQFANPIRFMVSRQTVREIADLDEAISYLSMSWPMEAGTYCQAAKRVLVAAIEGRRSVKDARKAVVAALHEARMFILN
ncbi:DUF982 domain-containing protein [Labrys okinawensis]|uniref:DUF982 domain-containing protein n=1 Tax=Labrys okinawensis TaxID=346911 RepID=UPI0039BD1810